MKKPITIKPIGIINTPYKEPKGMPIQGKFKRGVTGTARIFPEYKAGAKLTGRPFLEDTEHGIFVIRSPHRPNHIGFSIVKLKSVKENIITFTEVDILDGTPLLDIKPYVKHFDSRDKVKNGWIDKHFKTGKIPKRTKL